MTKPHKPKPTQIEAGLSVEVWGDYAVGIRVTREVEGQSVGLLYPEEARRLAKWLLKFAAWAESK